MTDAQAEAFLGQKEVDDLKRLGQLDLLRALIKLAKAGRVVVIKNKGQTPRIAFVEYVDESERANGLNVGGRHTEGP
jgi:hypothetical protein